MCYNLLNGQKGRCGMGVKFTSESEMERSLINELVSGVSQWTYREDLKSEADLWNNLKNKLENNNANILKEIPLTEQEFQQVKTQLTFPTFVDAAKWLAGENGIAKVQVQREDASLGTIRLSVLWREDIAGGHSSYEVVSQVKIMKNDEMDRNRRFDVSLLINGLPMIQVELKNRAHLIWMHSVKYKNICNKVSIQVFFRAYRCSLCLMGLIRDILHRRFAENLKSNFYLLG